MRCVDCRAGSIARKPLGSQAPRDRSHPGSARRLTQRLAADQLWRSEPERLVQLDRVEERLDVLDLAFLDPEQVHAVDGDRVAGRLRAGELASVRAGDGESHRDGVALGDRVVDVELAVWETD